MFLILGDHEQRNTVKKTSNENISVTNIIYLCTYRYFSMKIKDILLKEMKTDN